MSKEPTMTLETVTPGKAELWLKKNEGNRPLRNLHISTYSDAMKRGEWVQASGDPIIFEVGGRLQNGQHRLTAITRTGISQTFWVMRNADPIQQKVQDGGAKRSVADQFSMRGESDARFITMAAKHLYHQLNNPTRRQLSTRLHSLSAFQVDEVLADHPGLLESIPVGKKLYSLFKGPKELFTALHYTFSLIDKEDADYFFDKLVTGRGIEEGSAIEALRNRMIKWSGDWKLSGSGREEPWALIIIAWNKFRDNEPVKQLRYRPSAEGWPIPH